jgi:hypothetical protein
MKKHVVPTPLSGIRVEGRSLYKYYTDLNRLIL